MMHGRQFVFLIAVSLLITAGCARRKPQLPAQAKAPAEPIATPLPSEISDAETASAAPQSQRETSEAKEESAPKPAKHHNTNKKKNPPTTTVQTGSAPPPVATTPPANSASAGNSTLAMTHPPETPPDLAIAAGVPSAQVMRQKQTTAQLLDETEKTINGLGHSLSSGEEETLVQIRAYVSQSRKATTDGDFERAFNLATKAHLLSDALVKK